MRKTIIVAIISILILSGVTFAASNGYFEGFRIVNVNIDGVKVVGDVPAVILNGRTMVPLKVISEKLGANVSWDSSTYTVNLKSASNGNTDTSMIEDRLRIAEFYSMLDNFGAQLSAYADMISYFNIQYYNSSKFDVDEWDYLVYWLDQYIEMYNTLVEQNSKEIYNDLKVYTNNISDFNYILSKYYDSIEKYGKALENVQTMILTNNANSYYKTIADDNSAAKVFAAEGKSKAYIGLSAEFSMIRTLLSAIN